MKASRLRQFECIFEHEFRKKTIKCHQKPLSSWFVAPKSLAIISSRGLWKFSNLSVLVTPFFSRFFFCLWFYNEVSFEILATMLVERSNLKRNYEPSNIYISQYYTLQKSEVYASWNDDLLAKHLKICHTFRIRKPM